MRFARRFCRGAVPSEHGARIAEQRRDGDVVGEGNLDLGAQDEHAQLLDERVRAVARRHEQPAFGQLQDAEQRADAAACVGPAGERRVGGIEPENGVAQLAVQERGGVGAAHLDACPLSRAPHRREASLGIVLVSWIAAEYRSPKPVS